MGGNLGNDLPPGHTQCAESYKEKRPVNYSYALKGHQMEEVTTAKYLGVDLSNILVWRDHIDRIVKKANCTLGILRRNLRISNTDTKAAAYSSLVRLTLEYCASVWSPHTQTNQNTSWKWCKGGWPDTVLTDITIPAV